jgi:Flp pilus assembly pilin Flp
MAARPRLIRADDGATVVEFALVMPVLLLLLVGTFDVAMNLYATSVLQGSIQKAGRDFSLEDARSRQSTIESYITRQVRRVAPGASVTFARKAYFDFADVGQPEVYDDLNHDGACNNDEPFEDANGNGQWDADRGEAGFGGARDAILLTATARYDRLFPMDGLMGVPDQVTVTASTVLRNQPFDDQDRTIELGQCDR